MNNLIIVYYCNPSNKNIPAKLFLDNKYIPLHNDSNNIQEKKIDAYAHIYDIIKHVSENGGHPSISNYTENLSGHKFHQFRIKDKLERGMLIRIPYFVYRNQLLILLNAFEKSDNYDPNKLNRYINVKYNETNIYYKDFVKNPNHYEKYQ